MAAVLGQLLQQRALGGGQRQRIAAGQAHQGVLQFHRARPQLQHRRAALQRRPVGALQKVLDAQQQFLHQKRLGQVVVRPQTQPEQPVGVGIAGREEQRRDVRLRPQLPEQGEAVPVRQVDVQHHQVGPGRRERRPGRSAVLCRRKVLVPCRAQMLLQQFQQFRRVVHQQDFCVIDRLHGITSLPIIPYSGRMSTRRRQFLR